MSQPSPAPANVASVPTRTILLAGSALVLAALAVYANSFGGPFIFDDFLSIPDNASLRSLAAAFFPPGGGVTVSGRPLLNLSFALNYVVCGDAVWGYHAVNLLIHALAALTLFGVVRRTLADRENALAIAFASALLWTVHPLQTESVTYIVQRAESLMGLLYLLTLYGFIRGATGKPAWYAVSLTACLLGMATKEVMVTAPVLVLFYDRCFLAGTFRDAVRLRWRVYLALAATWFLLVVLVLQAPTRGGSAGFGAGASETSYLLSQGEAVLRYLWLAVWPGTLIIDYGSQGTAVGWAVLPYLVPMWLLVAATVWALVKKPQLGFLGAAFFGILAPTLLVPVVRQTLAEHRMYLSLAPVLILVVLGLFAWLGRRGLYVALALAVALGTTAAWRNLDYRSSETIWADTVAKRPSNAAARYNYGNILAKSGRAAEAMTHYEAAMKIEPDSPDAYFNAGNALKTLGRYEEAIASYEHALRCNGNAADAHTELASVLEIVGRLDEAVAHYRQALRCDPNFVHAHNSLGVLLAMAGQTGEAIEHFQRAIALKPSWAELHTNLGNALGMTGRVEEAQAQYELALKLDPDNAQAHRAYANLLRATEHLPEAVAHYERALQGEPAQPAVHNEIGLMLCVMGRVPEAITHFEAALRLNPEAAQVHLNLAAALKAVGRGAEAEAHLAAAKRLGLDPAKLGE